MISDIRQDCVTYAKQLGDYQHMTIGYLADNYCAYKDAGDNLQSSRYLAALILRFWSKIGKMKMSQPANLGLEMEDFYCWLYDAIELACQYRGWQNTSKHINAEQAINQCIETTKLRYLYQYRLAKHKINYNGNYSLDMPAVTGDDTNDVTLGDMVESEENGIETYINAQSVTEIIQRYINKNKIVEAIILSCIAYTDCSRETKEISYSVDSDGKKQKHTTKYREFWQHKCVETLSSLPESYDKGFKQMFNVGDSAFAAAMQAIRSANNQKLYRYLRSTLEYARKDFAY